MDAAHQAISLFGLVATIALALLIVIGVPILFKVAKRQAAKHGWRVVSRTQRMPLPAFIYLGGADIASLIAEDLQQYRLMYPELFRTPFRPVGEPVVCITGEGRCNVSLGGATYRVRLDQSRVPGWVTVRKAVKPIWLFAAAGSVSRGVSPGHGVSLALGLLTLLTITSLDPHGFGFMIAQCFQKAAAQGGDRFDRQRE